MGEAQPPLLAPRLPGVRPLLLRRGRVRAAFDKGRRRHGPVGGGRRVDGGDARRHGCPIGPRPGGRRRGGPRGALPDAPGPWHRRPLPAAVALASAGRAHRRAARRCRGRGPPGPRPPPRACQPADPRLRPRPRRCVDDRARDDLDPFLEPQAEGAVHLLPHRPRPRPARRRDRRRAAQAAPGRRDRLARPEPGHGRARGARRAHPPAERRARLGIRAHHRRIVRARPQRVPGDPADGRDPRRELHGVPRRDRERRVRPRDRR